MPSVSKKQHNLMALVANNPKAAKRLKIPQSVGEDFMKADKGKKFAKGGSLFKGKETYGEELKEAKAVKSGKITPAQFAKGEKSEGYGHEEKGAKALGQRIKSGKVSPSQYAKMEASEGMKKGGKVKKYAGGGDVSATKKPAKPAESDYDKRLREEALSEMRDKKMREQMGKAYDKARENSLGSPDKLRKGGCVKKYARGGGIEVRGKTRGRII